MMYRAKDKDGKEVKGQYLKIGDTHLLTTEYTERGGVHHPGFPNDICLIGFIEIPDPSTIAVSTGRKDKHGVEIFGSQGEFQGGDRVQLGCGCCFYKIEWRNMGWFPEDDGKSQVHKTDIDVWKCELKIIARAD